MSAPAMLSGLPPVVGDRPRVLVLGSMPGAASLHAGRYYAHPRNQFWPMMGALLDAGPDHSYPQRLRRLAAARVALWDVLAGCERRGSLDAAIRKPLANAFAPLLDRHAGIATLLFNGAAAHDAFRRLVLPCLPTPPPVLRRMPSTSPAHAAMPFEAKLEVWREALRDGGIRVSGRAVRPT